MPERCLLVIDMQNDFVGPSAVMRCEGGREIIPGVAALVDGTRAAGVPVIWVVQEHRRQLVDFGRELDGSPVHCVEGTPGVELAEPLRRRPDDFIVVKRRFSSFLGTDLDLLLHGLGVRELWVSGCATDGCVRSTVADGHQLGYRVRLVRDCVAGATVRRHEAALEYLGSLQPGMLATAEQALAAFRQERGQSQGQSPGQGQGA
ncbi:MAG TPA: isochorismatase family cysteine hydrolase [Bacillota bacterium]|jgi:nicotinamidase-related amidase